MENFQLLAPLLDIPLRPDRTPALTPEELRRRQRHGKSSRASAPCGPCLCVQWRRMGRKCRASNPRSLVSARPLWSGPKFRFPRYADAAAPSKGRLRALHSAGIDPEPRGNLPHPLGTIGAFRAARIRASSHLDSASAHPQGSFARARGPDMLRTFRRNAAGTP
jgi:hypothetical protein